MHSILLVDTVTFPSVYNSVSHTWAGWRSLGALHAVGAPDAVGARSPLQGLSPPARALLVSALGKRQPLQN